MTEKELQSVASKTSNDISKFSAHGKKLEDKFKIISKNNYIQPITKKPSMFEDLNVHSGAKTSRHTD